MIREAIEKLRKSIEEIEREEETEYNRLVKEGLYVSLKHLEEIENG